nr:reverse transcriptase domain-containing protein [Tanacetum cinerariifolium]
IANQILNGNGNVIAARAEGNSGFSWDVVYLQTRLLIAQKEEAGIQLQAEDFDLMADASGLDEIKEVNANCILMANLQRASTSGTQTNKTPIYDSNGLAEYTELLKPIPEPHHVQKNDSNIIFEVSSVEQDGGTIDQHPATVEETRAYFESLYNNLAIEVEKVNTVNRKDLRSIQVGSTNGIRACREALNKKKLRLHTRYVCYKKMDQDSAHMVAASKVHMLKPENGNAPPITKVVEGVKTTIAPTTAKSLMLKENKKRTKSGQNMTKTGSVKKQSSAPAQSSTPTLVKAVEPNCFTCGGTHSYQNCPATSENVYRDNIQVYVSQAAAANYNQENTGFRPQMVANQIQPPDFPPYQNTQNNFNRGNNFNQNRGGNFNKGVSALVPNLKSSIPYPSRRDNEKRRDQANEQIKKFYEIFKDMSFKISFTDALIRMPKFASTLKALIGNKEKLSEMARTPMNEHCLAVILNKLPRKLGDPGKFLIPCEFLGMDECLALADLGASINLMPLFVWEALSLPELTPTCMTLELADRSVSKLIGIAKDVSFKVGVFHFPADFVVIDFKPDPRVPLILERCFLKTVRALIDVHKG